MNEHEFLVSCKEKIDAKDADGLCQLLTEHEELVDIAGWELVTVIGACLKENEFSDVEKLKPALQILNEICSPKEFLLGITDSLQPCIIDSANKFNFVVEFTTKAFVNLKRGQEKQLTDIWERLFTCCQGLLSGIDKDDVQETVKAFKPVYIFLDEIVKHRLSYQRHEDLASYLMECSSGHLGWSDACVRRCRGHALTFLFQSMELLTKMFTTLKSLPLEIVKNLITCMFSLITIPELINLFDVKKANHPVGVALFFYHVLLDDAYAKEIPMVYRKEAIFLFLSPFILHTLDRTEDICIAVSLKLLDYTVISLSDKTLEKEFSKAGLLLLQRLSKVMIWCQNESHRLQSKSLFDVMQMKFKYNIQYDIYWQLYERTKHAGMCGYVISLIKDVMIQLVKNGEMRNEDLRGDVIRHCQQFLQVNLGETNVLHESDRLMAGLNFARYWLLFDKDLQKTLKINEQLQLIQRCIEASRQTLDDSDKKSRSEKSIPMELVIPGAVAFDQLPPEEKTRTISSAYLTLDTMSCVIARLYEIIDGK